MHYLIDGLSAIRTSLRQQLHSLPPSHRSPYLERHMLAKQKERLEREIAFLERRCQQCRQQLANIDAQLGAVLERKAGRERPAAAGPDEEGAAGRFTRMTVDY